MLTRSKSLGVIELMKARFAEDQGRVGHLSPHMTYEGFAGPHMKAFDLR